MHYKQLQCSHVDPQQHRRLKKLHIKTHITSFTIIGFYCLLYDTVGTALTVFRNQTVSTESFLWQGVCIVTRLWYFVHCGSFSVIWRNPTQNNLRFYHFICWFSPLLDRFCIFPWAHAFSLSTSDTSHSIA